MRRSLRRELRFLRAYVLVSTLTIVLAIGSAFGQPTSRSLGEITVERINVAEPDGRVRLVISNVAKFPAPRIGGKVGVRQGDASPGLIFYNDEGDEDGGLSFSGATRDGRAAADGALLFDQYKQDQTVGIMYSEENGQRTAGLHVWDRPEEPLTVLIDKLAAARAVADENARRAAIAAVRAQYPDRHRVFVGKLADRSSVVRLSDANGRPRLTLRVEADGAASIAFLDATGRVTRTLP
jgi:hypothetical protein